VRLGISGALACAAHPCLQGHNLPL
jgi:hypothetical protein